MLKNTPYTTLMSNMSSRSVHRELLTQLMSMILDSDCIRSAEANNAWKHYVFGIFPVCIFPSLDWIWRYSPYLSVFSPNARKYRPEQLQIRKHFRQWKLREIVTEMQDSLPKDNVVPAPTKQMLIYVQREASLPKMLSMKST